jgi:hypothetical protein
VSKKPRVGPTDQELSSARRAEHSAAVLAEFSSVKPVLEALCLGPVEVFVPKVRVAETRRFKAGNAKVTDVAMNGDWYLKKLETKLKRDEDSVAMLVVLYVDQRPDTAVVFLRLNDPEGQQYVQVVPLPGQSVPDVQEFFSTEGLTAMYIELVGVPHEELKRKVLNQDAPVAAPVDCVDPEIEMIDADDDLLHFPCVKSRPAHPPPDDPDFDEWCPEMVRSL